MRLTVLVFTYNHENYVAQALDSVLMQEFDGDYEVVIADDCSTDGTREILLEYQRKHPDTIRLVFADKNLNDNQITIQLFEEAAGQYIALLEGDDFWTSSSKLKKQLQFLDEHPECGMCFHNVAHLRENGDDRQVVHNSPDQKKFLSLNDVLQASSIAYGSVVCRAGLIERFPAWYRTIFGGDWALCILYAERATIGYLDEVMGTYRIHSGGVWSGLDAIGKLERSIQTEKDLDINFDGRYHSAFKRNIAFHNFFLALSHAERRNFRAAMRCFRDSIVRRPMSGWFPLREMRLVWPLLKSRLGFRNIR